MVDSDNSLSESRRTVESESNEYKRGVVDGSWLQHQCRKMMERNMDYMKMKKIDEGRGDEPNRASGVGVKSPRKGTKSRRIGTNGGKTSKPGMSSRPITETRKKDEKLETLNLAKLLDWSKRAGFLKLRKIQHNKK